MVIKMTFKMTLPSNPKVGGTMPHKVFARVYWTFDDAIHLGITRAAERVERKLPDPKPESLEYLVVKSKRDRTTYFVCLAASLSGPLYELLTTGLSGVYTSSFLLAGVNGVVSGLMSEAYHSTKAKIDEEVDSIPNRILQLVRLPLIIAGFVSVIYGSSLYGIHAISLGITAYLTSTSNGMLDRANAWMKGLFKAAGNLIGSLAPVKLRPVTLQMETHTD